MHSYTITTLVDITENGVLRSQFPFTTKSGELVHDSATLAIARNQQANFTTVLQMLQMRSNITWEITPQRMTDSVANYRFGTAYEGRHTIWQFTWQVEQAGVYEFDNDQVGGLVEDFDTIPIVNFCKETAAFPKNVFITQDSKYINTYFNPATDLDK